MPLAHVQIAPLAPQRFRSVLDDEQGADFERTIADGASILAGRVVWNVNSTAAGGGVAEMLQSLIAYARGAGVDARWLVIAGDPAFFRVTKRLHNRLHGMPGDGGRLGGRERGVYEAVTAANARELAALIRPGDLVLLHDPQTAGPHLGAPRDGGPSDLALPRRARRAQPSRTLRLALPPPVRRAGGGLGVLPPGVRMG